MTDHHGDVLTSGPGTPLSSIRPQDADGPGAAVDVEFTDDDYDDVAPAPDRRPNRLLGVLHGVLSPEAFSVTALVLLFLPMVAGTALRQLAGVMAGAGNATRADDVNPDMSLDRITKISSAFSTLSAGLALMAVVAGLAGLALTKSDTPRWVRGLAGASVLAGLLLAAADFAVRSSQASFYPF